MYCNVAHPVAVDQLPDATDIAQLAVFIRGDSGNLEISELVHVEGRVLIKFFSELGNIKCLGEKLLDLLRTGPQL
jgi:hypothetical protein